MVLFLLFWGPLLLAFSVRCSTFDTDERGNHGFLILLARLFTLCWVCGMTLLLCVMLGFWILCVFVFVGGGRRCCYDLLFASM